MTIQTHSRILLVDDNEELRALIREQLACEGYEVDEAEDGLKAIEMVKAGTYSLMLLDINMPGRSGLDVLKFVRKQTPDCKVIMLTGLTGLAAATESVRLGAEDYITKPYKLSYLVGSIKRALGQEG